VTTLPDNSAPGGAAEPERRPPDHSRPDNVTDRFNELATAAGVRPIGPHQIRHMLVSSLLDRGYSPHEIAERLGHDPATLLRFYARVHGQRRAGWPTPRRPS